MNYLNAALAARAHKRGRAFRTAQYRHRHLAGEPMAIVLWQLGAEPFAPAAIGWGVRPANLSLAVAGEPRNRDLAFAALRRFAQAFNPWFEAFTRDREEIQDGKRVLRIARVAPQVIVANGATATLLGNLGRRLAYLRTTGPQPAPLELVRLGRHLLFLHDALAIPGQQLLVCLTDLINHHWATSLSEVETQSLAALDGYLQPAPGEHAFVAATRAETLCVGPVPEGEDDERLAPLVEQFNTARAGRTEPAVIAPLLGPILAHYRPLVEHTWKLLWRCRDREARISEAPSVATRRDRDRQTYTRHIDWLEQGGLRRTRQTVRQAVFTLHNLEEAKDQVVAAEAVEDPLRMVPYLLANQAILGRVVAIDREHRELVKVKRMRRPRVVVHSQDLCRMPVGKGLYWTENADGGVFEVCSIETAPSGGSRVTLQTTDRQPLPALGAMACFSIHTTRRGYVPVLPNQTPWTHEPSVPVPEPQPLEAPEEGA